MRFVLQSPDVGASGAAPAPTAPIGGSSASGAGSSQAAPGAAVEKLGAYERARAAAERVNQQEQSRASAGEDGSGEDAGIQSSQDDQPEVRDDDNQDDQQAEPEASPELAQAHQHIEALEKRDNAWRDAAAQTVVQNRVLAMRLQIMEAKMAEAGINLSPHEQQILELQAKVMKSELGQHFVEGAKTREHQAKIENRAGDLRTQAEGVAKRSGIELKKLVTTWNALSESEGRTLGFDEVADLLKAHGARGANARQIQTNASAPRVLNGRGSNSAAAPMLGKATTKDAINARLRSLGHQLDS